MAIKESALSLITSIAQGDWVRAVTSAGASRRVTVANLAKAIVESYTGSSLAGSAQSVKSAIDSLNSKTIAYDTLINNAAVTAGTVTLYNNRRISSYEFFLILWLVGGNIRATSIAPRGLLANTSLYTEMFYVDSTNVQRWADVKAASDTAVTLSASSNATGTIMMYGLYLG